MICIEEAVKREKRDFGGSSFRGHCIWWVIHRNYEEMVGCSRTFKIESRVTVKEFLIRNGLTINKIIDIYLLIIGPDSQKN